MNTATIQIRSAAACGKCTVPTIIIGSSRPAAAAGVDSTTLVNMPDSGKTLQTSPFSGTFHLAQVRFLTSGQLVSREGRGWIFLQRLAF